MPAFACAVGRCKLISVMKAPGPTSNLRTRVDDSAWSQRLKLKYERLCSSFASNLTCAPLQRGGVHGVVVGGCDIPAVAGAARAARHDQDLRDGERVRGGRGADGRRHALRRGGGGREITSLVPDITGVQHAPSYNYRIFSTHPNHTPLTSVFNTHLSLCSVGASMYIFPYM